MNLSHLPQPLIIAAKQTAKLQQTIGNQSTALPFPKTVPRQNIDATAFNTSFPP